MSPLRIVIAGYIVRGPLGGLVWHHLQYALGLQLLGHEVLFLEDSDDYPACYNPLTHELGADAGYGLAFIREVFGRYGLDGHWAYHDAHTGRWFGQEAGTAISFCHSAEVFLNLSAMNPVRPWTEEIPVRILVDTDPVFTQIRHLTDPWARKLALRHNAFFSFGEHFGREDCFIPDDGFDWQPTRQPVVPGLWSYFPGDPGARWTTVMQWDSYQAREYGGRSFGMKSASFREYADLPARVFPERFELAIGSASAPREMLSQRGWMLTDPLTVTRTPERYRSFIAASKGEWSVAKQGYVAANSGWFSERSAAYLASGRPVVVEDTGFSRLFPTGHGLLGFSTPDDVPGALEAINGNYPAHCLAARELAHAYFDYRKVLGGLLESAGRPGVPDSVDGQ